MSPVRLTPSPKSAVIPALAIAGTVLLAQACDYPTFEFRSKGQVTTSTAGAGGTGTAFPTGGSAATGGTGAGTTTTTGAAGSGNTGAGATGGAPPCDPRNADACDSGQKCTWLAAASAFGCAQAGPDEAWDRCNGDADCNPGTWCDAVSGVCKPFCVGSGDCPTNASCIDARVEPDGALLPFKVCTSHCDPREGAPCGDGATCVYLYDQTEFDCAQSDNLAFGSACASDAECAPELLCPAPDLVCLHWCTCSNGFSPCNPIVCDYQDEQFYYCWPTTPEVTYDGTLLGLCAP